MSSKSISTGEFQWLNSGDEKKKQNVPPPKEVTNNSPPQVLNPHNPAWYSKKDPAQVQYSHNNPYIRNGRELNYEEQRFRSNPEFAPQTTANFMIPNQPQFMMPGQRTIPNGLPRSQSLPHGRGGMSSMQLQRQSMPNLLQPPNQQASSNQPTIALIPPRPMSHPPQAQIVNPQSQIPLITRQTTASLIPRPNVSPQIHHSHQMNAPQQLQRNHNQGHGKMVQNRYMPNHQKKQGRKRNKRKKHENQMRQQRHLIPNNSFNTFQIPHQMQPLQRSVIQPQRSVALIQRPTIQQFVVPSRHPGQAKVLQTRNGNVVTMAPQTQSLIQYNKPIMMNPSQHTTQFKPHIAFANHHLAPTSPSNNRASGGARQHHPRKPKNSKKQFHSVMKEISIDDRNGKKTSAQQPQTQSLLSYGSRIAYNTPLNHLAPNNTPLDQNSRKPNQVRQKKNAMTPALPTTFTQLLQTVDLVSNITKYLTLGEFLNLFGVLSQTLHDLIPHIGWVETVTITFGDASMISLNDNFYAVFSGEHDLALILKSLSSKIIRSVKIELEEDSRAAIPFSLLKGYFAGCEKLQDITIDSPHFEEKTKDWQEFLIDLDFAHLVIQKNPFPLENWFIKDLTIKHLTILSPRYRTSLELFTSLPITVSHISICRPHFSISKLLNARRRLIRVSIRNPARLPALEPSELLSLFTTCLVVELDFSLVGTFPDLSNHELSVERVVFISDGTNSTTAMRAKAMFPDEVDVSVLWPLLS